MKGLNTTPGTLVGEQEPGWEPVMEKKDFKVWRRPIPNSHLYEYRGEPSPRLTCGATCVLTNNHVVQQNDICALELLSLKV